MPEDFHLNTTGGAGESLFDYNGYIPDGAFKLVGGGGNPDITYNSVLEWQQSVFAKDLNSLVSDDARLVNQSPLEPEHFKLSVDSPAVTT
jgi:hypothetical protein